MEKIDESSKMVSPAELAMFTVAPTDPTFMQSEEVPHRPSTSISAGGPITFDVTANADDYIKVSNTGLEFGVQLLDENGNPITSADQVGVINNSGHSFWSSVEVKWNNTTVSYNTEYALQSYKISTLSYGEDAKRSHLSCGLYEKDTAGYMDDLPGGNNLGLNARTEYLANGKICYFRIRLNCDAFIVDR